MNVDSGFTSWLRKRLFQSGNSNYDHDDYLSLDQLVSFRIKTFGWSQKHDQTLVVLWLGTRYAIGVLFPVMMTKFVVKRFEGKGFLSKYSTLDTPHNEFALASTFECNTQYNECH